MSDGWAVRVTREIPPSAFETEVWYVRERVKGDAILALQGHLGLSNEVEVRADMQVPASTFDQMGIEQGGIKQM